MIVEVEETEPHLTTPPTDSLAGTILISVVHACVLFDMWCSTLIMSTELVELGGWSTE
jgi:hypothetical protein